MKGHSIRFTFDDGTVDAEIVCHEPEGADCRLTGGADCDCEQWGRIERRDDGTIWHELTDGYRDLTLPRNEPQWHQVGPMSDCNVALFINESGCVMEHAAQRGEFLLADLRIAPTWDGDNYLWWPLDPEPPQ